MASLEEQLEQARSDKADQAKELQALRQMIDQLTAANPQVPAGSQPQASTATGDVPVNAAQPNRVDSYRVPKMPVFFRKDPSLWFLRVESSFRSARITDQVTQVYFVIAALDEDVLSCCRDLITDVDVVDVYTKVKKRIIDTYSPSEESRLRQLLKGEVLNDGLPSLTLQRLRNLNNGSCGEEILETIFMDHLPQQCRAILAISEVKELNKLAELADNVYEATNASSQHVFASSTRGGIGPSQSLPDDAISKLTSAIAKLSSDVKQLQRGNSRGNSRPSRSRSISKPKGQAQSREKSSDRGDAKFCWAHRKFREKAYTCKPPCAWVQQNPGE